MDREGGNKGKMRKCIEWISLHFPILSPFPLHFLILSPSPLYFLILSPFLCSPTPRLKGVAQPCLKSYQTPFLLLFFSPFFLKNATKTVNNWLLICTNSSLLMISAMFKYVDEWSSRLDAGSLCGKIWKPLTNALTVLLPQQCRHDEGHHIVPGTKIKGQGGVLILIIKIVFLSVMI